MEGSNGARNPFQNAAGEHDENGRANRLRLVKAGSGKALGVLNAGFQRDNHAHSVDDSEDYPHEHEEGNGVIDLRCGENAFSCSGNRVSKKTAQTSPRVFVHGERYRDVLP